MIRFVDKKILDLGLDWPQLGANYDWITRKIWSISPFYFTVIAFSSILVSLTPSALAVLFGVLVGSVKQDLDSGDMSASLTWFTLILFLLLANGVTRVVQTYCNQRLGDKLNLALSREVFTHAAPLDLEFFEDPLKQDLLSRSTQNIGPRFYQIVFGSVTLVSQLLQLASLVAVLVYIDWSVTAVLLALSVPWVIFKLKLAKLRYEAYLAKSRQQRWTRYYGGLFTDRNQIPTIKLLGLDMLMLGRFEQTLDNILSIDKRTYRVQFFGDLAGTVILTLGFWLAIYYVGSSVFAGEISFELLLTFWIASARLRSAMDGFISYGSGFVENALFVNNIRDFFKQKPQINVDGGRPVPNDCKGQIEFRNVSFRYPGTDTWVLRDLNLVIPAGETVALVGNNGAGKTTIAKLMLRLYDVTEGAVLLDGENLKDFDVKSLYANMAYVPDKPVEFEATLKENIAFGNWSKVGGDSNEIDDVARAAGLSQVAESAPQGMETALGRLFGSHDLSTGQWQRVSLARALTRNASVYVLDEPTANVDVRSEMAFFRAFKRLVGSKTTILISHRFSTVRQADRIIVVENGEVAEQGSHDQLMSQKGIYASLYRLHQGDLGDAQPVRESTPP